MMRIIFSAFIFLLLAPCSVCFAKQEARSIAHDNHIKVINYNPQSVHKYIGFYGYQSSIVFEEGEVISTISLGDSTGWQLSVQDNRLFIKPIADNPNTNGTIITNKRVYYFEFFAEEATGLDDPRLAYEVRFIYPVSDSLNDISDGGMIFSPIQTEIPDLTDIDIAKKGLNFNYSVSHSIGSEGIVPLRVFDDQRFTYLQFQNVNADLPSVFTVDSGGYESLINFRVVSNYIIIERVGSVFTLRHGSDTVCLFNDNRPFKGVKINIR